ncbi:MAG: diacylglycerol kinase [marine bacterium B5-7]|nr:MAG: diacylglycerol kinase [marine bacterium B5-7]
MLAFSSIVSAQTSTGEVDTKTDEVSNEVAGEYLVTAGGCIACHTVEDGDAGDYMAGGRALDTPFGTFHTPNITPDVETGIGAFSKQDFIRAFREGLSPDGSHYYPAFPYTSYTGLSDTDLESIKRYLDSIPPIRRENRPHELDWYVSFRWLLGPWKWLNFTAGVYVPDPNNDEQWNRGAYLVRHLGHCDECHTPRNFMGALDQDRELAGNPDGPEGDAVPNITPDRESGIGKWSKSDLRDFLEIGMYPDGDFVGGSMVEVVDFNTGKLTSADRDAIIRYLKSLPPIDSSQ